MAFLFHFQNIPTYNSIFYIGFYGGEPLLNFNLIEEVITYVESLSRHTRMRFAYNMTTNALLLSKYMDYLVEKDFSLLISLDGNKFNDSYRVTKQNKESFDIVLKNVDELRFKYPDYFQKRVNFNAVLHNRNSVKDILSFIKSHFGKIPSIAGLATNGIRKDKQEEFLQMFRNQIESYKEASACMDLSEMFEKSPASAESNFFINAYCGQIFTRFSDLFVYEKEREYIPTGTCKPLRKKMFLTVNGKLLPCERVGQENLLGRVEDGKVILNMETVSQSYEKLLGKIVNLCRTCAINKSCGMCIFHQEPALNGAFQCKAYFPQTRINELFSSYLTYFEENRDSYEKVIKELIIL